MTEDLHDILRAEVLARSECSSVALLLSGGLDSFITGFICHEVGKEVIAHTYELEGIPSSERPIAEAIARHMGWPLRVVRVPTTDVRSTFIRLAIQHRCAKKTQFEVTFAITHLISRILQTEIFTGWNFDDNYGNTAKDVLEMYRLRQSGYSEAQLKAHFDASRDKKYAKFDAESSSDTFWFAHRIAASLGKRLIDPSTAPSVRRYFRQFSHDELSSPTKPLIRTIFADALQRLPAGLIAKGIKLQKGGGVHQLFQTLIDDPVINRFERKYAVVAALCQRWAREVRANPEKYSEELAALPRPQNAVVIKARGTEPLRPTMADVSAASKRVLFTAISLFAGGGGSSMGLRLAGGRVLAISEFIAEAARTYHRNFPETLIETRDIRDLLRDPASVIALLELVGLVVGALDYLDGSPPCSEFSTAGRGPAEPGVFKPYSDRKQRDISFLAFEFARFALIARPKVVVMENVPALASRGKEIFDAVIRMLSADYFVASRVLAASDYGVPQKRRRLFILGVRKDVARAVDIQDDTAVSRLFPNPTHVGATIRDAFAGLVQSADDVRPWLSSARTTSLGTAISGLPKDPPRLLRPDHLRPGYTLTRSSYDLPAPTLTVTGQQPSALAGVVHPEHDRKFTIPELKRLFAVPDDFILTGTVGQAAERLCRMVPPPLTEAIANTVYERVLRPFKEQEK